MKHLYTAKNAREDSIISSARNRDEEKLLNFIMDQIQNAAAFDGLDQIDIPSINPSLILIGDLEYLGYTIWLTNAAKKIYRIKWSIK